jgi:hypothetical protein
MDGIVGTNKLGLAERPGRESRQVLTGNGGRAEADEAVQVIDCGERSR